MMAGFRHIHQDERTLIIGHPDGAQKEATISMPYRARAAHMHVIGRSGSGKSRFLADLIRQDIINGSGVCLIDPHGELYNLTVNWLAQYDQRRLVSRRKIHALRLTDFNAVLRFNPLQVETPEEAYTVAANVSDALTRIFGGTDGTETPRFTRIVDTICTILALRRLPLAAAEHFLVDTDEDRAVARLICAGVEDENLRRRGLALTNLDKRLFAEKLESTDNRSYKLFRNPHLRRIFSTTENTLPLKEIMDSGQVLLFDLSDEDNRLTFAELRMFGALFVNNLFGAARKRKPQDKPRPFMLYIDEVQNYINHDIEEILAQARKRGLFLTLAHQDLGQLKTAGEAIYSGVMSNALIKAVFGMTMREADELVDEIFAHQVDFERVKEKLASPHVVGHEREYLSSRAEASGTAELHSRATSSGTGRSRGNCKD